MSIMNACLHELAWVLRASYELAWRLASTTQQHWCTGYEPGRLLMLPFIIGERAPALSTNVDVGLVPAALQRVVGLTSRLDCTLAPSTAEGTVPAGRAADGLPRRRRAVPRRLSEKKRSLFSDIHHLPVDPASRSSRRVKRDGAVA